MSLLQTNPGRQDMRSTQRDPVRLADFIVDNTEPILEEWVAFARTCGPEGIALDLLALRDHALQMLQVIARDLRTPQTAAEQDDKAKGQAPDNTDDPETAAEDHGADRAESGFSVEDMVSEYRALRASVIRLWTTAHGTLTGEDLDDLMRFNEAIDQALAESITRYSQNIDQSKEVFLAMLGHDLRSPLGAVIMASQFMLDTGELEEPHLTLTTRIASSSKRMNRMVGDLLDYTRSSLGPGLPIVRKEMDLGREVQNAVDELTAGHPDVSIAVETTGELRGEWDCGRVGQLLSNLIGNAVQHGVPNTTVNVTARGEPAGATIRVHNFGSPIPPAELPGLFSPFKRLRTEAVTSGATDSLGLGLYIADRIVTAHGGTIAVESSADAGTSFTVFLPVT